MSRPATYIDAGLFEAPNVNEVVWGTERQQLNPFCWQIQIGKSNDPLDVRMHCST